MAEKMIPLSSLKPNPQNPRLIKDARFKKMIQSIKEFPKMMGLRPMIIDKTKNIIAGNQRYHALVHLGFTEIPAEWVKKASDLTIEERDRFIVMDNDHFGEHDYKKLAEGWDLKALENWGLKMPDLDNKTAVSFKARKVKKGCLIKVICTDETTTIELANRLIKEGFEIEIK